MFSIPGLISLTRLELWNLSQTATASQHLQKFGFHSSIINQFLSHTDIFTLCRDSFIGPKPSPPASDSPLKLLCGPGEEREMIAASGCTVLFFFCHYRCFSILRGKHSSQENRITHWSRIHPPDFKAACLWESQKSSNWVFSLTPPTRFISVVIIFSHQLRTFKWRFGLMQMLFQ